MSKESRESCIFISVEQEKKRRRKIKKGKKLKYGRRESERLGDEKGGEKENREETLYKLFGLEG